MSWPWEQYGGSFVWKHAEGLAAMPMRCCPNMQPKLVGDCGRGCCEDFLCESCGKKWRYEYPD